MKRNVWITMLMTFSMILLMSTAQNAHAEDNDEVASATNLKGLVELLADEGEFENDQAVHALTLHLTAVNHYEKQDKKDKVIKHMKGFKVLLDHQKENGQISDDAYTELKDNSDDLISEWDALNIVKDGQAQAVVIAADDIYEHVPDWTIWNREGFNGYAEFVPGIAHTGEFSVAIKQMGHGMFQNRKLPVEPGPFEFSIYYFTLDQDDSEIQIQMRLKGKNNKLLKKIISENVSSADTVGEWEKLTLQGNIPKKVDDQEVKEVDASVFIKDQKDIPLYLDDVHLYQEDPSENLLDNSGFEEIEYSKPIDTLVDYVQKSTGAELPVVTEEVLQENKNEFTDDTKIYIGQSALDEEADIEEQLEDLNDQGFVIHPHEDSVTIVGPTEWGTLYGVYDFLERYLGIRWLLPGEDWEDVPQKSNVWVPQNDVREEPAFQYRQLSPFRSSPDADGKYQIGNEWAQRNKLQGNYNQTIYNMHNLYSLFDPEKFGETHPEFYPDGNPPASGIQSNWQPCFTEEGTVDAAVSEIINHFDEHPDKDYYSLGVNDGGGYCETDPDHPDYPDKRNSEGDPDMSGIYYEWVNEVVEQVREVYPDKWFGLLAYNNVTDAPSFELDSHVVPFVTKDRMTWIDDELREQDHDRMDTWNEVASQVGWYDYMYGVQFALPRVYPHRMAKNYQYAEENHVYGTYSEMYFNAGDGPKAWLYTKLHWNPDQDVDALLDEWYERAVGKAAAPDLKAYYDLWEEFWTERIKDSDWFNDGKGRAHMPLDDASYLTLVTEEDLAESEQLLDFVVAKAQTDQQKERAQQLQKMFEYYKASVLSYPIKDEVETPVDEEEALKLLDDIEQSTEMGLIRLELIDEFEDIPALKFHSQPRDKWSGVQHSSFIALQNYLQFESEDGIVGERVDEFLDGLSENIRKQYLADIPNYYAADAMKTKANKENILASLNFSRGPWKDAEPITDFYVMGSTSEEPPEKTNVYLLWDDENFYVGYENFDADFSGKKEGWRGNSDQTFISAERDGMLHGYLNDPDADKFSFIQDPDGNREQIDTDSWDTSAEGTEDRWNAVKVIPFSDIGVDPNETDKIWSMFFRNYHDQSVLIGWQGGHPWEPTDLRPIHLVSSHTKNGSFEQGDKKADEWRFWTDSSRTGTIERVEGTARTGNASLLFDYFDRGGPHQTFDAVEGRLTAQLYYSTPPGTETDGTITLTIRLKDADGNNLDSTSSGKIPISDTGGEWIPIEHRATIPAEMDGVDVEYAYVLAVIDRADDAEVYIDDFEAYLDLKD